MAVARARIVSGLLGFAVLGAICLMAAGTAHAQVKRSLSGSNLRFQIGGELQIPIAATFNTMYGMTGMVPAACLPKGGINGVNPTMNAQVSTWATGRMRIPTSAFTLRGPKGNPMYTAKVIGVRSQNPVALQVKTDFQIQIPQPSAKQTMTRGLYVDSAGGNVPKRRVDGGMSGRTGPDVLSWCPGSTATVAGGPNFTMTSTLPMNPGCANPIGGGSLVKIHSCKASPNPCPGPGYEYKLIPGFMKYTRTGKRLGGPANGKLKGPAEVFLGATGGGAFRVDLTITTMGFTTMGMTTMKGDPAIGGSFGEFFQQNAGKGPHFLTVMHNACGIISKLGPPGVTMAFENRTSASFGGPVTQGTLTVAAATAAGVEMYKLVGYDHRGPNYGPNTMGTMAVKGGLPAYKAGQGRLQLVTGSISLRSTSGSNANQGVLNFQIPEPAMAAGAVAALLVLAACHRVMNRRR